MKQAGLLARRAFCLIACLSLLAGCAQMQGVPTMLGMGSGNLATDPADPCGAQRAAFNDSRNYFTRDIVIKTAGGAVIGAAAGAAIGGATNGLRGALAGAAIGAVGGAALGLASGYYDKLQQANLDQATLARQVNQDVTSENQQIDHTAATFASLRSCRFNQAAFVKNEARRGIIPRPDALAQLDQQRTWFAQEVAVARDAGVNMKSRDDQFAYAANNLPKTPRRTDPGAQATKVATETIPQKRNSFESAVGNADTQSKVAFNLDNSAQT
jgi:hypothetical protein